MSRTKIIKTLETLNAIFEKYFGWNFEQISTTLCTLIIMGVFIYIFGIVGIPIYFIFAFICWAIVNYLSYKLTLFKISDIILIFWGPMALTYYILGEI